MREWWAKLAGLLGRRDDLPDQDLPEEIEANLSLAIEENLARGMNADDARADALRRFGNVTLTVEKSREVWTFPSLEAWLQDVRYGWRGMLRARTSSGVIILTLALGIGATTAIFSVIHTMLLQPLPYPNGERLVRLQETTKEIEGFSVTWVNYQAWRNGSRSFEDLAAFHSAQLTLTGRGDAILTRGGVVTGNFFALIGNRTVVGRTFSEKEDRPGSTPTVVLSEGFWKKHFAADPAVTRATATLDGKLYEVIGVVSDEPRFLGPGVDYYLPLGLLDGDTVDRGKHGSIGVVGLLRHGVTLDAALSDLNRLMASLATSDPGPESNHRATGTLLSKDVVREYESPLSLLMGAVSLVLIIACANVASLVLARSMTRSREMAIRAAIGAGPGRLTRQLLTENLLLAAIAGLAGLLLARAILAGLIHIAPRGYQRLDQTNLDLPVLLFGLSIAALTGLLVGIAPALAARKPTLVAALNAGGRSSTSGKNPRSLRDVLVVAEIAITLVLAFGAGLLLRSLLAAETADPGFVPEHVLNVGMVLPDTAYADSGQKQRFFEKMLERLRSLPEVLEASAVCSAPAEGECFDWFYSIPGKPTPAQADQTVALFNIAEPGYFQLIRIPIREGRDFTNADLPNGPPVAIVNERFARQWWPKQSALGQQIKKGGPSRKGPTYEIVGVVGNVGQDGLDSAPYPEVFLPFAQAASAGMKVLIRFRGEPGQLEPAVRGVVAGLDRNLPIQSLAPFTRAVESTLDRRRFLTLLLTIFAGLAMLLAAVGIYGLLNYWVTVREDEIAIRMAVGAPRWRILRFVAQEALRLIAIGLVIGAVATWLASRWMESLVYGVSSRDSWNIVAAMAAVIALALSAAALPMWRATQVDPMNRLKQA